MRNTWNARNTNHIRPEELTETVMAGLDEYRKMCVDDMKECVKDSAKFLQKELKATSPVAAKGKYRGQYAKSWKIHKNFESYERIDLIVYAGIYWIAHLLENGHAKRGGGWVDARPHIAPAEKKAEKKLMEDIVTALDNGGRV